jgi:hypothetical protein
MTAGRAAAGTHSAWCAALRGGKGSEGDLEKERKMFIF